jgi:2,3-bisphosphoglycerate-dependent phosphoglycerate mutase
MGRSRGNDGVEAFFTSDLTMAIETVRIAFPDPTIPMFMDWRLRECDYGEMTDIPPELLERAEYIDVPYPAGESWRQAVEGGRVLSIRVLARPCGSRS